LTILTTTTAVPITVIINQRVYAKGNPSNPIEIPITIGMSNAKIPAVQFPRPPKTA